MFVLHQPGSRCSASLIHRLNQGKRLDHLERQSDGAVASVQEQQLYAACLHAHHCHRDDGSVCEREGRWICVGHGEGEKPSTLHAMSVMVDRLQNGKKSPNA